MFDESIEARRHPLAEVADETVLSWCARDPRRNFEAAAAWVPFHKTQPSHSARVWSDLALEMLRRAPDRVAALKCFVERFSPHAWSGSRAAIIEANAQLLTNIEGWDDPELARVAREERERLLDEARREKEQEAQWRRREDERFE